MRKSSLTLLFLLASLAWSLAAPGREPARPDPPLEAGIPIHLNLSPGFSGGERAVSLWRKGKRAEALHVLQQAKASGVTEQRRQLMIGALQLELDRPGPAAAALAKAAGLPEIDDHVIALRGQALLEAKRPEEALEILRTMPAGSPLETRTARLVARSELERGHPGLAITALEPLTKNRLLEALDPATLQLMGDALAALGTAEADREALRHYRALRIHHPLCSEAKAAARGLTTLAGRGVKVPADTLAEQYTTASKYLEAFLNEEAVKRLEPLFAAAPEKDPLRCDVAYSLGKAWQNLRKYTSSEPALAVAAEECDRDRQVRALFMLGRGSLRKGNLEAAEKMMRDLVARFPDHSYADDALFLVGVSLQDQGEQAKATALLEEQIRLYPTGDMRGEATWRLAWADYRQNRLPQAIARVEALLSQARREADAARGVSPARVTPSGAGSSLEKPPDAGPTTAPGSNGSSAEADGASADGAPALSEARLTREAYWRARWLELEQPKNRARAASAYETLARFAPVDYYGLLAFRRLAALDRDRAHALEKEARAILHTKLPRREIDLAEQPAAIRRAVELLRAGQDSRAIRELSPLVAPATATGDLLVSWLLDRAGSFELSHQIPRNHLNGNGFSRVDPENRPLFMLGFPKAFEEEVKKATESRALDPFLLTALAREESAFDPNVRSWAGAVGLTQLMESTARIIARQLKVKQFSPAQLTDPAFNLELGAQYLTNLLKLFDGHPGLAVPGYNAGEGAVAKWVKARGDLPFDEFVEEIPYKQTRDYVRRVLASYQTYHYLYRSKQPFIVLPLEIPRKK